MIKFNFETVFALNNPVRKFRVTDRSSYPKICMRLYIKIIDSSKSDCTNDASRIINKALFVKCSEYTIIDISNTTSKISNITKATTIGGDIIPRLIDEIPVISILAAQAEGTTIIKDAAELKVKESNRIATTVNMLKHLGVKVEETEDGMIIEGRAGLAFDNGQEVSIDSHGDHRLAMSSAVAAMHSNTAVEILQTEFVKTSFPGFFDLLELKQVAR